MLCHVQLDKTLFLKPSVVPNNCCAEMYILSSCSFKTWCFVNKERPLTLSPGMISLTTSSRDLTPSLSPRMIFPPTTSFSSTVNDEVVLRPYSFFGTRLFQFHDDATNIYGHSRQYYFHQQKYVSYQQELLSDRKHFPNLPMDSDRKVIVDTHPDSAPPRPSKVIRNKKCRATFGNHASPLQGGKPVFNKNGKATSFTFDQL